MRESVVYHLLFDGDIGRLTGLQLKQHLEGICNYPVEQQILTLNGQVVANDTIGYNVNLKDGSMLLLDNVARSATATAPGSASRVANESQRRSAPQQQPTTPGGSSTLFNQQQRQQQQTITRLESEIDAIRRKEDAIMRRQDELRRGGNATFTGLNNDRTYPSFAPAGLQDEVEFDVDIVEEPTKLAWQPANSTDVEEARLLQQDYVWKMEQVRFETERMNREREIARQRQELEYQSELLDRDRIDLERRTQLERQRFEGLQKQIREELAVQSRLGGVDSFTRY